MTYRVTLDRAPLHAPLTLTGVEVSAATIARLTALGVRRGALVRLVQDLASGARVVSVGGGRLALGRDVLSGLSAEAAA